MTTLHFNANNSAFRACIAYAGTTINGVYLAQDTLICNAPSCSGKLINSVVKCGACELHSTLMSDPTIPELKVIQAKPSIIAKIKKIVCGKG